MNVLMMMFLALSIQQIDPAQAKRLDNKAIKRAMKHQGLFERASKKHNIPTYILYGVAMNESTMIQRAQSGKGDFGLMQIRCRTDAWSWLPWLKKNGLKIKRCTDLYRPHINIEAGAMILSHLQDFYNTKEWLLILTGYKCGSRWIKSKKPMAKDYHHKVLYFGTVLEKILSGERKG